VRGGLGLGAPDLGNDEQIGPRGSVRGRAQEQRHRCSSSRVVVRVPELRVAVGVLDLWGGSGAAARRSPVTAQGEGEKQKSRGLPSHPCGKRLEG
jgi:hypothetical protein